jgi:tetrahydromethanopterin S-methyltransferase subunit A
MKKKIIYSTTSFFAVLLIHFAYTVWQTIETTNKWKQVKEINPFWQYFERQDFFLGLSYALTAAFTAYAIANFLEKRKSGIVGTVGGFTLAGLLYFAGCFLTGCCGSPMLTVYLSLFGSSVLGFAKPLTAGLTTMSVILGFAWINRNSKTKVCSGNDVCCSPSKSPQRGDLKTNELVSNNSQEQDKKEFGMNEVNNKIDKHKMINKIRSEMEEGINLLKCQQCGCMKETLEILKSDFPSDVDYWEKKMIPIKYSCLGCAHCYPAVAMNLFNEAFPEKVNTQLDCAFEVKDDKWPYVAGEYYAFCGGDYCPVAVSTLGDTELADRLAKNHPDELCIVGKTETENIGVDKVIKNVITNPTIKYLLLVGQEPKGHKSGETFISLSNNGVDDKMRVIGSTAKKPILRNVSIEEINYFRNQVEVVNLIGCSDDNIIIDEIKKLAMLAPTLAGKKNPVTAKASCRCSSCNNEKQEGVIKDVEVIQAKEPKNIIMDKAGYFVILPIPEKNIINVEHYSYDNTLLRVIEGKDARSIYWTIIENKWVTFLSHAAYLGKELTKAELSLKYGFKYVQDGA